MSEFQPSTFYIDLFALDQHYMSVGVIGTADLQPSYHSYQNHVLN